MHGFYKEGDTTLIMHCVVTTILAKDPTVIYILPGKYWIQQLIKTYMEIHMQT